MAITTTIIDLTTGDGTNVESALIKMVDDTPDINPIIIRIRRNPGHATEEDSIDPHNKIALTYLPAIEQAMDDILGEPEPVVRAAFNVQVSETLRRYT